LERRISITNEGAPREGVVVVAVAGEIDLLTSDEFASRLKDTMVSTNRIVVLDLSDVRFLGSAALSVLASSAAEAKTAGIDFRLVANERVVLRPLEIAGVSQTLTVYESIDSALNTHDR
jgi:anti-anti-sigma factor